MSVLMIREEDYPKKVCSECKVEKIKFSNFSPTASKCRDCIKNARILKPRTNKRLQRSWNHMGNSRTSSKAESVWSHRFG